VQVRPPEGMHRESVLLDGEPLPDGDSGLKIDLSQDRVLAVRFKYDN
jgi:hypothetical protein